MLEQKTDKQAESDADVFDECMARLELAIACEGSNRTEALKALQFRYIDQWDADDRNARDFEGRPALTVNHTDTLCRKTENQLKQARPRIKVHAVDDGADLEIADIESGMIRHIENVSQASIAYDRAGTSAIDIGWGYWRIMAEYCDPKSRYQELKIKQIRNSLTVYDDPSCMDPTGADRKWLIITSKMKRAEAKRLKIPLTDFSGPAAPGDPTLDWENKEEIRLAEYYRIHEKVEWLYYLADGSTLFESELPSKEVQEALGMKLEIDPNGKPLGRQSCKYQVQWFKLNGTKVVDKRDLPGKWISVIRTLGNEIDINGKILRWGMIKNMMEPAQMYNYASTMATERYALAPKAPWVAAEGQIEGHPEWDDANQKSYSVLKYKPTTGPNGELLPPPQRTPPVPAEEGMATWAAQAERDLMAVTGMQAENPGDARILAGNKYLQRRLAERDLSHFQYFDNQSLAIAQTGRIIVDLIPYYYDTKRIQRIIGEDGTSSTVTLNDATESNGVRTVKNDMTVGEFDVVMDAGPSYQTKREEAAETMVNLLGTPLGEPMIKVGADLIVRNIDAPGLQEMADRLATQTPKGLEKVMEQLPKQAQTIVKTLMTQNQQLQQQLQSAMQEIKVKTGIEQMRQDGETHRTMIKSGTDDKNSERDFKGWMHDIDVKSTTARDVAEIHGATALLNTRLEAEANEKAADKMIEKGLAEET